jgi:hypothetical protein
MKDEQTESELEDIHMEEWDYDPTEIPTVDCTIPTIRSCNELAEIKANRYFGYYLEKGKYDIDYVINLLKIIMQKCEQMKMNPKDLQFTLWTSTQKLLSMLEVERDQK